jgi:hypothetical protein
MNGNESDIDQAAYSKIPALSPDTVAPQRIFNKLSTRLGCIALRASLITRQFVSREANFPTPWGFLSNPIQTTFGNSQDIARDTTLDTHQITDQNVTQDTKEVKAQKRAVYDRDEKLKKILSESGDVLAKATTVFPFSFFPDDIVVDRTKVTLTKRNFFFTSEVTSIRIEDILHVRVASGPLLGSLVLVVRILNSEDRYNINNFWKKDATHLKHLIHGYVIAQHNDIDTNHLPKDELISTLCRLGHDSQ